jgi:hypothetical protein
METYDSTVSYDADLITYPRAAVEDAGRIILSRILELYDVLANRTIVL